MKRIAVDMDQVIANLLPEWINRYNNDYNDNIQYNEITDWNFHEILKPECNKKIYDYMDDPELFENLPVIENSQRVLEKLSRDHEIFIVTAPWNAYNVVPKTIWLQRHFPFINKDNYVFTRNKSIVRAEYLIDDRPSNFLGFYGFPMLYDAPHNRKETKYKRFNNWLEIEEFFDNGGIYTEWF